MPYTPRRILPMGQGMESNPHPRREPEREIPLPMPPRSSGERRAADPFDGVAAELEDCLEQVQGVLGSVLDGGFALDPDAGMGGIDGATRQLKQLLSLPEWPTEPAECDLGARVRAAVRDLLAQQERPMVVRIAVDPDLPRLAMRPSEVDDGLEELLEMATTHCGSDGELAVRLEAHGYGMQLTVQAVPGGAVSRAGGPGRWQLDDRLERMVDHGHGRCATSLGEDGTLTLELQLDTVLRSA